MVGRIIGFCSISVSLILSLEVDFQQQASLELLSVGGSDTDFHDLARDATLVENKFKGSGHTSILKGKVKETGGYILKLMLKFEGTIKSLSVMDSSHMLVK